MRHRPAIAALCLALSGSTFAGSPAAPVLKCELTPSKPGAPHADVKTREAAHKGLTYLSRASQEWTARNNCFGCHVQAVTLEALTVGKHHQYEIPAKDLDAMVHALMLGVTAGGHTTGAAFQGQAWARYDQWVAGQRTEQLLKYAKELTGYQHEDGSVPDDDARLPTYPAEVRNGMAHRQPVFFVGDDKPHQRIGVADDVLGAGMY